MLSLLDLIATFIFAATGATVAFQQRSSIFGVCLSAMLSAFGGGTVRDFLLQREAIFWMENQYYILAVACGVYYSLMIELCQLKRPGSNSIIDSLATTVFVVVGVEVSLSTGCNSLFVIVMGALTGIGGTILRQVIIERRARILESKTGTLAVIATAIVSMLFAYSGYLQIFGIAFTAGIHWLVATNFKARPAKTLIPSDPRGR